MRVEIERAVDAAFKRVVHDEIEPLQMLDHVALDSAADKIGKGLLDPFRRQIALEQFEIGGVIGPDIDV